MNGKYALGQIRADQEFFVYSEKVCLEIITLFGI